MKLENLSAAIAAHNENHLQEHPREFAFLAERLARRGLDPEALVEKIARFRVAVPSWALGAGGTRFGRYPLGGEPRNVEEKLEDVGLLRTLTDSTDAVSLHIPWDTPHDAAALRRKADALGLRFDAMNSNTFQDQPGQPHSYKFGSLCHTDPAVRRQAVEHNLEVIEWGKALGSRALTVWLADGSNHPGQQDFRAAFERTRACLQEIYAYLPPDWRLFIEYKPYEPHFYSMVVPDWGTALWLAESCGERASVLVDLGHHLPNTNIEQIVALLLLRGRLGGFHFNDSKYGDDDLTVGALKPFQLFLIFNELVQTLEDPANPLPEPAWMIDASHNLKDPLEDLIQSLEAIRLAYARALLVDRSALHEAREGNDPARAQEILQDAFRSDVRPLLREARLRRGAALEPLTCFRALEIRKQRIQERGTHNRATGL